MKKANREIEVMDVPVKVTRIDEADFISLTDIARHRDAERSDYIIQNWMRNRNTIEFLGIWEQLNNPAFNSIEFDGIGHQAGLNSFSLTPKRWISQTGAVGIVAKTGRYGGTFAHRDIAFEFASWVSVEFKLYLIKEFQRLQEAEQKQLGWDVRRNLTKINYRIHTDAFKEHLIPPALSPRQINLVYAGEIHALLERVKISEEQSGDALRLRKLNRIMSIHASTAIEGNRLTLGQVSDVINGKRVLGHQRISERCRMRGWPMRTCRTMTPGLSVIC